MKRTSLAALLLVPIFGFIGYSTSTTPPSTQLVVYVTSSNPDVPVTFEAAYLFKQETCELKVVEATTPFSVTAVSEVFSGIFRQVSGEASLEVKLVARQGRQEHELAQGQGAVVLLNELAGKRSVAEF